MGRQLLALAGGKRRRSGLGSKLRAGRYLAREAASLPPARGGAGMKGERPTQWSDDTRTALNAHTGFRGASRSCASEKSLHCAGTRKGRLVAPRAAKPAY